MFYCISRFLKNEVIDISILVLKSHDRKLTHFRSRGQKRLTYIGHFAIMRSEMVNFYIVNLHTS